MDCHVIIRRVWEVFRQQFDSVHLVDHKPKFMLSLIRIQNKSFLLKNVRIKLYLHSTDLDVKDSLQSFVSKESTLRDKNDVCIATLGQGHFLISK